MITILLCLKICSKLLSCREKITDEYMLEKTFSTFHVSNMLLQQYREIGFKKYYELISCLLVAEQNNKLLMKNHDSRPTRATFPKVNSLFWNNNGRDRSRGQGRDHSKGRSNYTFYGNNHSDFKKTTNEDHIGKTPQNKKLKSGKNQWFCCGMNGHWTRTCRTSKHLVDLYQVSLKENVEVNFVYQDDVCDSSSMIHLNVVDFFESLEEKIDVNDGVVNTSFNYGNAQNWYLHYVLCSLLTVS